MQVKYCDLVGVHEALAHLDETGPGLYDDKIAFPSLVGSASG
jgi:hypothetical protein